MKKEEKFPKEVYCVIDARGDAHFFFDINECPVYYSGSIQIAFYELNYIGKLTTTVTLMKDENE